MGMISLEKGHGKNVVFMNETSPSFCWSVVSVYVYAYVFV